MHTLSRKVNAALVVSRSCERATFAKAGARIDVVISKAGEPAHAKSQVPFVRTRQPGN